jgi:hypothetical protein
MNLVSEPGSCRTVRNHDDGAPAREAPETTQPISFRPGIHRTGRFVESQYGSLPQESSRHPQTTPAELPA